jgi:hypothetical protein
MTDKPEKIFLTPPRREFLKDPESCSESARRSHYYRLRTRARMALNELIEVYESDAIPNEEIFAPSDVKRLFGALFGDVDDITARNEYDGDYVEWAKEYKYEDALLGELNNIDMTWRLLLLGGPAEAPEGHKQFMEQLQARTLARMKDESNEDEDEAEG